uniref:Katanin interacting protein n=1 Tax=Sphenodon punctatus TaxID=8508 RepID=A0A8D0HPI4_SPHPU
QVLQFLRKAGSSRSLLPGCTMDMATEFDEKHDEYLILLQQRNRIFSHRKRKDPMQIKLEHLEQGFSLYINGANSEPINYRRKTSSQDGVQVAKTNDSGTRALSKETEMQGHSTQTSPSKIQRKEWFQKSVQIKTESGSRVYIAPPPEYSDDFEPYGMLTNLFDFYQELRKSLELSVNQQSMGMDCPSDDYDSVEEDVPSEPSLMKETIEHFGNLQLSGKDASPPKDTFKYQDAVRCCDLDAGSLIVLEFKPTLRSESLCPVLLMLQNCRPVSRLERPLSETPRNVCKKKDSEQSATAVFEAMKAENENLQKEMLCRRLETSIGRQMVWSCNKRNVENSDHLRTKAKVQDAIYVTMEILSNWGNAVSVGLTEVEFFDLDNVKLFVSAHDVDIRNADFPGDLRHLVNRNQNISKEHFLWMCPFYPPIQLYFVIRNPSQSSDFGISKIKIWSYNTTTLSDLDVGAKNVKVYVDQTLVFDGELEKGCGNLNTDYSTTVYFKNKEQENFAYSTKGDDSAWTPLNINKEPYLKYLEPKRISINYNSSLEENLPEEINSISLTKLEDLKVLSPASLGDLKNTTTSGVMEHIQSDDEFTMSEQMEKLTEKKMSECTSLTPSWLQSSFHVKEKSQVISIKQKPSWTNHAIDQRHTDSTKDCLGLTDEDACCHQNESGKFNSRNANTDDTLQTVANKDCTADLDILDLLSHKYYCTPEHPTHGRSHHRSLRKEALSNTYQGAEGPPNEDKSLFFKGLKTSRTRWHSEQEHTLQESWNSLLKFNLSHHGRISNMNFQGDILDELLHQQNIVQQTDGYDFKIPVLPYGQNLRIDIKSTWGDRHYVGLNGIEIFNSKGEPIQISKIKAEPPDINILPSYGKDPRVITNLIDGVNRTQDDMHLWLAPFMPGKPHFISVDFLNPCQVAMIRIWNYNKSRIHSFRGVKDVTMLLDEQCIFNGEIAKASGALSGAPEHFGDTILFTTEDDILEAIFCYDETYDGDIESVCSLRNEEELKRPRTADGEEDERSFTQAGLRMEDKQVVRISPPPCSGEGPVVWQQSQLPPLPSSRGGTASSSGAGNPSSPPSSRLRSVAVSAVNTRGGGKVEVGVLGMWWGC